MNVVWYFMSSSLTPMSEVELAGWRTIVSSVCFVSGINKPVKVRVCLASSLSLSLTCWQCVLSYLSCCASLCGMLCKFLVQCSRQYRNVAPLSPFAFFLQLLNKWTNSRHFCLKKARCYFPSFLAIHPQWH